MESYDTIIIGAGVAGSAAALKLAGRGRVLLLEAFEFGHGRGSSHGGSRIFRHAYEDARYVKLALEADEAWRTLEHDADDKLLYRTGGLDFAKAGNVTLEAIRASLGDTGRPSETLSAEEVNRRFPAFRLEPDNIAVYQPDAAILAPSRALNVMQRLAATRGATLKEQEEVTGLEFYTTHVEVFTPKGLYAAERLIVTAGAWLTQQLSELGLPLHVEQQQVLYLRVNDAPSFAPGTMPVFIGRDSGIYGFPLFDHPVAIKVSDHEGAPRINLSERSFELNRAAADITIRRAQALMPGVSSDLVRYDTCLYTKTPDEHFILDRHPDFANVVIGGGFSGHGFKFGSVLGEILADLSDSGTSRHDLSLFGLRRFLRAQPVP